MEEAVCSRSEQLCSFAMLSQVITCSAMKTIYFQPIQVSVVVSATYLTQEQKKIQSLNGMVTFTSLVKWQHQFLTNFIWKIIKQWNSDSGGGKSLFNSMPI